MGDRMVMSLSVILWNSIVVGGGGQLETWLMQKTMEVTMVLRTKVSSAAELKQMMPQMLGTDCSDYVSIGARLALLVQKRRKALDAAALPPAGAKGKRTLDYLRKWVPQTTAATLWPRIVARTDADGIRLGTTRQGPIRAQLDTG